MQLYALPISTYCAKVEVVLTVKGVNYERLPPPDGYGSAAYKAIVPLGTIPGLVDGDVVLSESEAIVEYLDERYPAPPLHGATPVERAHVRTLSRVHDTQVEPALRALFAHVSPDTRDAGFVATRSADLHRRLDNLSTLATPSPWVAGERLTLADCAWATTFAQAEMMLPAMGVTFELPESLSGWRAALDQHIAVAPRVAECRAAMRNWLQAKGATAP